MSISSLFPRLPTHTTWYGLLTRQSWSDGFNVIQCHRKNSIRLIRRWIPLPPMRKSVSRWDVWKVSAVDLFDYQHANNLLEGAERFLRAVRRGEAGRRGWGKVAVWLTAAVVQQSVRLYILRRRNLILLLRHVCVTLMIIRCQQ